MLYSMLNETKDQVNDEHSTNNNQSPASLLGGPNDPESHRESHLTLASPWSHESPPPVDDLFWA
jgi:hypothetical protein